MGISRKILSVKKMQLSLSTTILHLYIILTTACAFTSSITSTNRINRAGFILSSSTDAQSPAPLSTTFITDSAVTPTNEWELDCYSRPVLFEGKKLWEVLITDSSGSFRLCETLSSSKVNSRELRRVVEDAIENAPTKPNIIRFFRGAMFNMINIALSEVDVVAKPSRCTFSLAQWLEERNRDIYPKMEGYRPTMAGKGVSSFLMSTPVKLPESLLGEKYAFVALPLAEFRKGGSVDSENIGVGKLCPVDPLLPADAFVQGVVILTSRAEGLSSWLSGTELAGFKADLRQRVLVMETNIDNQFLMAKLNDVQREEGAAFEEGKDNLGGLHFVCVQEDDDSDPAGFWLLREFPEGI